MAERVSGVYRIMHKQSGTTYVGSSLNVEERWKQHQWGLNGHWHRNAALQQAWCKDGEDAFVFEVLEYCSLEKRTEREQVWLSKIAQEVEVYNVSLDVTRHPQSEESLRKTAEANARSYPAFINHYSGLRIPSGKNLTEVCRKYGLSQGNMWGVIQGARHSHKGWYVEGREWVSTAEARSRANGHPYPAFYNEKTGEVIVAGVGLKAVCIERGLHISAMCAVKNRRSRVHKGWILKEMMNEDSVDRLPRQLHLGLKGELGAEGS